VRLVESAIKPQVKVLLVMAKPNADIDWKHGFGGPRVLGPEIEGDGGGWYMAVGIPESFEIDLQSDGAEALKHYRERGPYDLVLSDLRLPGLSGPALGAAIRAENRGQRIVLMTETRSVGPDIRKQLGEIPLLNLNNIPARRPQKRASMKLFEDSEGKRLLDWVEVGLKAKPNRAKSRV
jgi:CheY-like chemotaxis protein